MTHPAGMDPRWLYASALTCMGVLHLVSAPGDAPVVRLGDTGLHEGERVTVEAMVGSAKMGFAGLRLELQADSHTLAAVIPEGAASGAATRPAGPEGPSLVTPGAWVAASGRLERADGRLTMRIDDLRAADVASVPRPSWDAVLRDPKAWTRSPFTLEGHVVDGHLTKDDARIAWRSEEHATIRLGIGSWPPSGHVAATGLLRPDSSCACHRFDATTVLMLA